jgi:hypothetical protein
MTHVIQPLDVAIFNPYKHWHDKAVKKAIREGETTYGIADFMYDLPEIRDQTFKPRTIKKGFTDAGLWPLDEKKTLAKMKIYKDPQVPDHLWTIIDTPCSKDPDEGLPLLPPLLPPRKPLHFNDGI